MDDKKAKLELSKRTFEYKLKNTYRVESQTGLTSINYNKVNYIAECNYLNF